MTGFILCADDFALTSKVSRGILALLEAGRISAAGAMTNRPAWRELAPALLEFAAVADLGVHLSLTCGAPLGAMARLAPGGTLPGLADVARAAVASRAVRDEIAGEVERQLDAFEQVTGRAPDFVDGHQHVHALPGVRSAILPVLARRYAGRGVYVRDPADRLGAILARGGASAKALAVAAFATGFGPRARREGLLTNAGFAGFSSFDPARSDEAMFARFLVARGPRHLVMCHPGEPDDSELAGLDPVAHSRPAELAALMGLAWPGGARPVRMRDLA